MASKKHFPHLDGIRGLVVLLVLCYHLGYTLTRHAWLCISIFFSLSGLLITGITVDAFEKTRRIEILGFWARRVARLFPALLITVLVTSIVSSFRVKDPETKFFLRGDLLCSLAYIQNFNLIWRKDDYFAGFQEPSPLRHIWTLAIEEQYYLVWPLFFSCWVGLFRFFDRRGRMSYGNLAQAAAVADLKDVELEDQTSQIMEHAEQLQNSEEETTSQQGGNAIRECLVVLAVGHVGVIVFSVWSAEQTIREDGLTAAYYSTWSRCGDFACGGLVWLLVRLTPSLHARYYQHADDEAKEAMTTGYRLLLEGIFTACVGMIVLPGTLQLELNTMLRFYFDYYRVPFSFGSMAGTVAGALQLSEPLPAWALTSRLMSSVLLTSIGLASYSLYLYHWPLIVWLGRPMNHERLEREGTDTGAEALSASLLNLGLAALSIALALTSFFAVERPLARAAVHVQPWQTLGVGLSACGVLAGVVMLCTSGAEDPWAGTGDDDWVLTPLANPWEAIRGLNTSDVSPMSRVGFFTSVKSGVSVESILGPWAFDLSDFSSYGNTMSMHEHVFEDVSTAVSANTVLFLCRSLWRRHKHPVVHPCDLTWAPNVSVIWVEGADVCGGNEAQGKEQMFERSCEDRVAIYSLELQPVQVWPALTDTSVGYTGRHDADDVVLSELVLNASAAYPALFDVALVKLLREVHDAEQQRLEEVRQYHAAASRFGILRVAIVGNSVGNRLGKFMKELLEEVGPCVGSHNDTFPAVEFLDLAVGSTPFYDFFSNETTRAIVGDDVAGTHTPEKEAETLQKVPSARPSVLIIVDHFLFFGARQPEQLQQPVRDAFLQAMESGVEQLFTFAVAGLRPKHLVADQLRTVREVAAELACSSSEGDEGIRLTILHYYRLECPTFDAVPETKTCDNSAHGFTPMIPDRLHPSGFAGRWIAAQSLAAVFQQLEGFYGAKSLRQEIPLAQCLLEAHPPDGDPKLDEIVESHQICHPK